MTCARSQIATRQAARTPGRHVAASVALSLSACIAASAPVDGEGTSLPARDVVLEQPTPTTEPADAARLDLEGERTCRPWRVETVGTQLGTLENLLPESADGLLLADATGGRLLRFSRADHSVTTVRDDVPAIGGLATRDGWIYAALGNDIWSGLTGTQSGQIVRFLGPSGALESWADRLIMPNGLALLPDGSAVTTRDIDLFGATPSGITRVPGTPPRERQLSWSSLEGSNGAAVDPTGTWLYVSRTFTTRAEIWRIAVDDPQQRELVADLGPGLALLLDDLTVTQRYVYVAANLAGSIFRVDIESGASCQIASGLTLPSAVKFGAPDAGSGRERLYATSLAGDFYELREE